MSEYLPWIVLLIYVLTLLLIDFFVLHKKDRVTSVRRAILETTFFVINALLFAGVIYYFYNSGMVENPKNLEPGTAVVKYLTGYVIELSLSVDNLFVIAVIFTSFKIPKQYQHNLLFLGILGAIVFRAILISIGLILINKFHGMNIVFGLFLLFTALKMLKKEDKDKEKKEPNWLMKLFRISRELHEGKYIAKVNGKRVFTALFGALITIELTDLLFALDSIPAIFAVTTDPYIVFSSNIFAVMGLRSLYFFLSTMLEKFGYLKYSVFVILLFVAFKLIAATWIELPEWLSLLVIGLSLATGILVSISKSKSD